MLTSNSYMIKSKPMYLNNCKYDNINARGTSHLTSFHLSQLFGVSERYFGGAHLVYYLGNTTQRVECLVYMSL